MWINESIRRCLVKRLGLQASPLIADAIPLGNTVIPVTVIDDLLLVPNSAADPYDLYTVGNYIIFTVPTGKRYHLYFIFKIATTGNVFIYKIPVSGTNRWVSYGTAQINNNYNPPLLFSQGESLVLGASVESTDDDSECSFWWIEETVEPL